MNTQLIDDAAELARQVHADQRRKGTDLGYFDGHLEPVARLVAESGGSDVQVAAAYLHDAVEDGGGIKLRDRIERDFGPEVASIVVHLSDSLVDTTGGAVKEDWAARKRRYVAGLAAAPPEAIEVSVADKLHNAQSILDDYERDGPSIWKDLFPNEPRPERQLWYYTSLLAVFEDRIPDHPLTARLADVASALTTAIRTDEPDIDDRLSEARSELG